MSVSIPSGPGRARQTSRSPSPAGSFAPRSFSTARLASPLPGPGSFRNVPRDVGGTTGTHLNRFARFEDAIDDDSPLPGQASTSQSNRTSSLSKALRQSFRRSPPRFAGAASDVREESVDNHSVRQKIPDLCGSFDARGRRASNLNANEDIETVRRHLVGPSHQSSDTNLKSRGSQPVSDKPDVARPISNEDDEFSSLQLQGGDITRHIYRYTEAAEREQREEEERREGKMKRSVSMFLPPAAATEDFDEIENIKKPGGLRREYIARKAGSPAPSDRFARPISSDDKATSPPSGNERRPKFVANNFIEFLTLYGHFAGEELEEDDELLGEGEYFDNDDDTGPDYSDDAEEPTERSALLTPGPKKRKRKERGAGKGGSGGAAMLLLKSFIGTGVLFLPRAFLNGGMLFSNIVLLLVSALSFWCFILLVNTRLQVKASFGDMGGKIYGDKFRNLVNFSLVLSQIGFTSAYIVFVSENLQAFILAVSKCRTFIDVKYLILMQMLIFLPISLYRNINHIQKLALVADLFIALGLFYLYYYDIWTIADKHSLSDVVLFNSNDWTLFIGTAIFTFEGIGLIIPIQSSMKEPSKFPRVLAIVMAVVCVIYLSIGTLSYAAYGSSTKTVILLNLPQDSKAVNGVQFIYSLAILLSTPLQIYPAIEITSQQLFSKTGKYNPRIKWKKNIFRFFMVVLCSAIAWAGADDLDKFVALVGSLFCLPLVICYPPLMHYKAVARTSFQRVSDLGLVALRIVAMFYTTSLTVYNWLHGSRAKAPGYCDQF